MLEGWLTIVVLGVLVALVAFNFAVLLFACYEYAASPKKDPWLRDTQVVMPQAGNARRSVIMVHGFGGTPRDFLPLAERLAGVGFRVVVPAVPYQTSASFAYGRGRFTPAAYVDWLLDLMKEETASSGSPPILVGLSMGGTLAVIGAAEHRAERLVLLAPYFSLAIGDAWIGRITRWLEWMVPVVPKLAKGQIVDPDGYRAYETGSYLVSLAAFRQLAELCSMAKGKVPGLALPILVVAPRGDTVASFDVTDRLFRGREGVRMLACEGNHILTYDLDRERVMMEVVAFLAPEMSAKGGS